MSLLGVVVRVADVRCKVVANRTRLDTRTGGGGSSVMVVMDDCEVGGCDGLGFASDLDLIRSRLCWRRRGRWRCDAFVGVGIDSEWLVRFSRRARRRQRLLLADNEHARAHQQRAHEEERQEPGTASMSKCHDDSRGEWQVERDLRRTRGNTDVRQGVAAVCFVNAVLGVVRASLVLSCPHIMSLLSRFLRPSACTSRSATAE